MQKSQSQQIIYGQSSYGAEGKQHNQSVSMNSSTLHDSNAPSKVNKTKAHNNSTLLQSVTDFPNTFILQNQQEESTFEKNQQQKKRKQKGKQGSYLEQIERTKKRTTLKFPEIEHSPDRIRQYESKQYGQLNVHLPTLCFNSGWNTQDPSQSNQKLTRVQSEQLKLSDLTSTGGFKPSLEPVNPFKKSRKGENLLYQHEVEKRGEDENFVHASKVSIAAKSVPRRVGQVRVFDNIPAAKLPERLSKKQQLLKSQSLAALHREQISGINLQTSVKQSLQALMEKYEKHPLVEQKTSDASKQATVDILKRANTMGKEQSHVFLSATRDILRANLNIQNIKEESLKLKEYIVMEQEKVQDAKLQFTEDCSKFKEFMQQLNQKSKEVENELEEARKKKQSLQSESESIQAEIKGVKTELKRIEESLEEALANRQFVEAVLECGDRSPKNTDPENDKLFVTQQQQSKQSSFPNLDVRNFRKAVTSLEKQNLFIIEDINEEERMKDLQKRQISKTIAAKEAEVQAFQGNLDRLGHALAHMESRISYFGKKGKELEQRGGERKEEGWERVREIVDRLFWVMEPEKDQHRTIIKKLERVEYDLNYLLEAREYMLMQEGTAKQCKDKEKEIDLFRRHENVRRMKEQEKEDRLRYIAKNEERARKNYAKTIQKGTKTPMKRSEKEEPVRKKKKSVELTEEQKDFVKYVLN